MGRVAGPFQQPPFKHFVVSPLGVVNKTEPGAFRLIHHLSYPEGDSVNHWLGEGACSVSYCSLDMAVDLVRRAGRGAWLAKADIESAFRLLPVHLDDQHLLGFKWLGDFYYDKCLPMGCAVSCAYFEAFSSFLQWALTNTGDVVGVTHYLDDFLFIGAAGTQECSRGLQDFQDLARHLGVPLAPGKTEGPAQTLTFFRHRARHCLGRAETPG